MRKLQALLVGVTFVFLSLSTTAFAAEKSGELKKLDDYAMKQKEAVVEGRGLFKKKKKITREELCWELYKACVDMCSVIFDVNTNLMGGVGDGYGFSPPGTSSAGQYNACVSNCRSNWNECKKS